MGESEYPEVVQTAERLCQQVNLRLEMARLIARQPNDVAAFTGEDYFRPYVFLSFVGHFRMQISENDTASFCSAAPKHCRD